MLRITRFIKKEKLFNLIDDLNIGKFELHTSLNKNLNDRTVVKVNVYIRIPKQNFYNFVDKYLTKSKNEKNNMVFVTLTQAKVDYFLKESAFDDFGSEYPPSKEMSEIFNKYNQQYFWNL